MGQLPVLQRCRRTDLSLSCGRRSELGRRAEWLWCSLWLRNLKRSLSGPLRKRLQIPHFKEINEVNERAKLEVVRNNTDKRENHARH